VSSRRKEKQKRKEERRLAPPKRPRLPPIPAEYGTISRDVDRTPEEFAALLDEPGAVLLLPCARCGKLFDLSQGEGVEYGEGDGSGHKSEIYFCSACFIEFESGPGSGTSAKL
jgi:hypothetical protein